MSPKAQGVSPRETEHSRECCGEHLELAHFNFYFGLCWIFIAANRLPLIVAIRGYSPVAVLRLLIAVAPPVAENRLWGMGSIVVVDRLSYPTACEILVLDQESNPCVLLWKADS